MRLLSFCFLFAVLNVAAQETLPATQRDTTFYTKVDSLYREDQFYFGVTYNLLQQTPVGFSQNGLSTGFHFGFLRDMPVNKKRTFAVATGLGISYNKYHQNLVVSIFDGNPNYGLVQDASYSRNKLEQVFIDLPLEIRWRNSTPESHKFWRVYAGFKVRYLIFDKSKYVAATEEITVTNNKDFNQFQYGPFLSFGFNTWNFHAYYGLNSLFKSAQIDGQLTELKTLNLGLQFYIL